MASLVLPSAILDFFGYCFCTMADVLPKFYTPHVINAQRFIVPQTGSPCPEVGSGLPREDFGGLRVLGAGLEQCGETYRIDRGDFPFFCLELVGGGQGSLVLGGVRYDLGIGTVFAYGPGIHHTILAQEDGLRKYFVDFEGSGVGDWFGEAGLGPGVVLSCTQPEQLGGIFDLMIRAGSENRPSAQLFTGRLLWSMAALIRDSCNPYTGYRATGGRSYRTWAESKAYLDLHFARLETLEQAAKELGLDSAWLCRLFARYGRVSPYGYLVQRKIQQAAALLQDGTLSVAEVAFKVGYRDQFSFARAFKRLTGVAPSRYYRRSVVPL